MDMEELFSHFSISEIFLCIILLVGAVKWLVEFIDWAKERIRKWYKKDTVEDTLQEDVNRKFHEEDERIAALEMQQQEMIKILNSVDDKVVLLINSDKDDIKSYITNLHHQCCYHQKWIDTYTLECCERRYDHYKDEGGNSFIANFMEDLRDLPNEDPTTLK